MTTEGKNSTVGHVALWLLNASKQWLQQAGSFLVGNKKKLPFYMIITVVSKHLVINMMKTYFGLIISQGHWTWNDPVLLKGGPKSTLSSSLFLW